VRRVWICALIALGPQGLAVDQSAAVGEVGAQFLKLPVGPKAAALGGAFVAVADDPSAVHWNPGGLALLQTTQVLGMHSSWLDEATYQYVAIAIPHVHGLSLGIAGLYSGSGDLVGRAVDFSPTGSYNAYDLALGLAAARPFGQHLRIGLGVKLLQQRIEEETASAVGFDLGLLYDIAPMPGLRLGLAMRNVGTEPEFIEHSDPLPTTWSAGLGFARGRFRGSADLERPRFDRMRIHAGGELALNPTLALRAGVRTRPDLDPVWTAGVGLRWHRVLTEYAYLPFPEIEASHTIGLTLSLGGSPQ